MKILSDFDGVLTNLASEVEQVKNNFRTLLKKHAPTYDASHYLSSLEGMMDAYPHQFGWEENGRISAFCNEDGFIRTNALAALLDKQRQEKQPAAAELWQSLKGNWTDFKALASQAYLQMVEHTKQAAVKPVETDTAPTISKLLALGHEVVVVSNSGTERIIQILESAGLKPEAHTENPQAKFRVRGNARKFVLGNSATWLEVGPYRVETTRPHYEEILREEKPDAVIGDVFSLDLAAPYTLARAHQIPARHLFLRRREYTPRWSQDFISQDNSRNQTTEVHLGILDSIHQLLDYV